MSRAGSAPARAVAITGGARGIGRATAQALRDRGARLAIGDIDENAARETAAALGEGAFAGPLDVSSEASFAAFLTMAERALGPLDVLINNAGIMPLAPMLEESDETARRVLDINVHGPLLGMKLALPGMLWRGRGQIVNVASAAGRSPVPGAASYAASKAAVLSLTETARVEYAGRGVSFTAVLPSFTDTELILGTTGTRLVRTIKPEQVGEAIAAAVEKPVNDVFVPGSIGPILRLQSLTGRRLRDLMNRQLGADRVFIDVDSSARSSYDERISGERSAHHPGDGAEAHPAAEQERTPI